MTKRLPTLVLIDDDELIQASWKLSAKEKNHEILCFNSSQDFLAASVEKNTPIFIDYHFRSGENGLDIVKELDRLGYQKLFITTGSAPAVLENPSHIQDIVGKDYPM